ncbi:unnamed protein product [Schistosoma turkestanicum]|nr:unnamed protein product [Schistosoma turkestanicum]
MCFGKSMCSSIPWIQYAANPCDTNVHSIINESPNVQHASYFLPLEQSLTFPKHNSKLRIPERIILPQMICGNNPNIPTTNPNSPLETKICQMNANPFPNTHFSQNSSVQDVTLPKISDLCDPSVLLTPPPPLLPGSCSPSSFEQTNSSSISIRNSVALNAKCSDLSRHITSGTPFVKIYVHGQTDTSSYTAKAMRDLCPLEIYNNKNGRQFHVVILSNSSRTRCNQVPILPDSSQFYSDPPNPPQNGLTIQPTHFSLTASHMSAFSAPNSSPLGSSLVVTSGNNNNNNSKDYSPTADSVQENLTPTPNSFQNLKANHLDTSAEYCIYLFIYNTVDELLECYEQIKHESSISTVQKPIKVLAYLRCSNGNIFEKSNIILSGLAISSRFRIPYLAVNSELMEVLLDNLLCLTINTQLEKNQTTYTSNPNNSFIDWKSFINIDYLSITEFISSPEIFLDRVFTESKFQFVGFLTALILSNCNIESGCTDSHTTNHKLLFVPSTIYPEDSQSNGTSNRNSSSYSYVHFVQLDEVIEYVLFQTPTFSTAYSLRSILIHYSSSSWSETKQGTLKTLDGSIKRQFPDGRVTSVSLRCTDLDQEMVTSLGVSKAVLENVIFCHQEDSNWPLQEAKSVKQRFDDLFASSRYVKALDAIRKCKQDNDGNVKLYKTELKHLTKNRDEALKLRSEREETLHSIEKQEKHLEEISAKLQPVVEQLNRYKERYAELTKLQAEIKSCEAERAHLTDAIKNLMLNIQDEYQGSDEELKRLIEDAETEYEKKNLLLNQSENALQKKRKELNNLETNQTKTIVEKTQIEMEVKRLNEAIINRDMILASVVANYIPSDKYENVKQFTDVDVEYIVQFVDGLLHESENQLTEVKLLSANEERKVQSDVDLVRDELAALKQKIETIKRNYNQKSSEVISVRKRLENEHSLNERIEKIKNEFHKSEITVKDLNMDHELNNLHQSITESLAKKKELEHTISLLDEKIATFQKNANKYRELELMQKERASKLEGVRKIRSRHAEALEQVFAGSMIPLISTEKSLEEQANPNNIRSFINDQTRLRVVFAKLLNELEQSARDTRRQLAKLEQERSSLEATSKFTRNHLQEKRDQLKTLEEKLLSVPGADDLEQTLINLQEKRSLLEEEYANEQGSVFLWRKFRDRLSRIDSDCPVCHRCFDSDTERDELLNEIDKRIQTLPSEFERKKQELNEIVSRLESLVELRPISLEIKRLHEEQIPDLESKTKAELDKLADVRSQRDKLLSPRLMLIISVSLKNIMLSLAMPYFSFMSRIFDHTFICIINLVSNIQFIIFDSQSIDVLHEERKSLRGTLLTFSETIDQKQKRVDQLNQAQREAINEMHRLKDQMHKLEQENLDNVQLKNDLSRLTHECETLKKELSELESEQLPIVHCRWTEACDERSRIAKVRERNIQQATTKVTEISENLKKVTDACTLVKIASDSQPVERLKVILETVEQLQHNFSLIKSEADTFIENIEHLKKQISEHKMRQRELADCVQLRQLRFQLSLLTERTESLAKNQMINDNIPLSDQDLISETKRLSLEEEKISLRKQDISNQLSELNAKLLYLNRDLNEKYSNADNEYRDMMYQLKTSELACSDLERYYKALDRAIMSYHAVKMADLNKIIRELWRSTYRGNDIDYIEICSEEDTAAALNACRTRRTYNYRVVMVKTTSGSMSIPRPKSKNSTICSNEARLDMRGRCSAGQKVLASLIIRLALAEVFCLHCGVLALDEPTTNLDRENIESLAYALVEIIKNRSRQKNFQLIVITHDEDFVELLGRSDYVENFFLLSRNTQGLSEIRKVPIGEHFH